LKAVKRAFKFVLLMIPALAIYFIIAHYLDFIQDDAFITFRYIANYLNGDGLVYNIGEHIEGFTNFGWTIYLLLWGGRGIDYILVAKISGLIFGALSLLLIYLIANQIFEKKNRWFAVLPVYLVAGNFSFAYWSPAGLETAAFTFLALLSVYQYLKRSWLLAASLALAVWVRPEGALISVILVAMEAFSERKFPRFALTSATIAFITSLPFLFFKFHYYGSILPNPFYAKTGFDTEQLLNGLEYAGQFFQHYGFFGIGFIIVLISFKRLSRPMKVILLFTLAYIAYVTLIGGDVLKVHRFFLPIFGTAAIVNSMSLALLFNRFRAKTKLFFLVVSSIPLLWLTYRLPNEHVMHYNTYEKAFVSKMDFIANEIKRTDTTNFSVAIGTIGKFGYVLLGHTVIDILGLTDSTIARHSQTDIVGLKTSWKERKFNVRYILERAPDYILFSTGSKPSAPAEKALCLYPAFFQSYIPIPWSRKTQSTQTMGSPNIAFKKVRPVNANLGNPYPIQYVEYLKLGQEQYPSYNFTRALAYFDSAIAVSPRPYNDYLLYEKSFALGKLGEFDSAKPILNEVVKEDSLFAFAQRDLYLYAMIDADSVKAAIHEKWIKRLTPWYWDEIKAVVDNQLGSRNKSR